MVLNYKNTLIYTIHENTQNYLPIVNLVEVWWCWILEGPLTILLIIIWWSPSLHFFIYSGGEPYLTSFKGGIYGWWLKTQSSCYTGIAWGLHFNPPPSNKLWKVSRFVTRKKKNIAGSPPTTRHFENFLFWFTGFSFAPYILGFWIIAFGLWWYEDVSAAWFGVLMKL